MTPGWAFSLPNSNLIWVIVAIPETGYALVAPLADYDGVGKPDYILDQSDYSELTDRAVIDMSRSQRLECPQLEQLLGEKIIVERAMMRPEVIQRLFYSTEFLRRIPTRYQRPPLD
jgi:hypothetical protein